MAFRLEGTPTTLQINAGDVWHDLHAIGAVAGMLAKAESFRRARGSAGLGVNIVFDDHFPGWRAAVTASITEDPVRVREGVTGDGIEVRIAAGAYPVIQPGSVMQTSLILKLPE